MIFNSLKFLIFFPIVVIVYYLLKDKYKNYWLLLASYFFYYTCSNRLIILLLITTISTYFGALYIEKNENANTRKNILILILLINFGFLIYFKYTNFFIEIINDISNVIGNNNIDFLNIVLPVGISFYTFQAIGYLIDVYRNEVKAENNFIDYALFVSFFLCILSGPIEKSKNLLKQLKNSNKFNYDNFRYGLILMLYGYFLKIVIADRAAIFVDAVYQNLESFNGLYYLAATFLFAIQIYCDFYGYSIIAKGAAKILGFDLINNFDSPYFSNSVSLFWRKWHISLSTWFRDYLYIPLGGNRKGKLKNILIC